MPHARPLILLAQLPIPPAGIEPVRGNVPLAAAYLKLVARRRGLDAHFRIEILPAPLANTLSDAGLVTAILQRQPAMVSFTCYVWNIDRTLWVTERLKQQRPDLTIILGGPEITRDNAGVLASPAVDLAAIGEGEQTLAELLGAMASTGNARPTIAGLWQRGVAQPPRPRQPLTNLDEICSPYLEGILDAAEEQMMLLETARGCIFKCRFCYYPKSYDRLYQLGHPQIAANLRHAAARGAREVFLLDPTLNQRRDFPELLRLLARENPDRQFTYSAELRAEGITADTAQLLAEANFAEVEVGLQSVERAAQDLMDRRVNQKAFQRGTQAMLDAGIRVRVDLIVGLPGDTPDSVRRGIDYLASLRPRCESQVFNLAILPGTAFREDAARLGLRHQPRPPYYALETPTFTTSDLVDLVTEAQEALGIEFDPLPPPRLELPSVAGATAAAQIDLDLPVAELPPADQRTQAFVLWLQSRDFEQSQQRAAALIRQVLADSPHTTLEVVLEPRTAHQRLQTATLERLLAACYQSTSYLDRYYSLHPGRTLGAKRLVLLLPAPERARLGLDWIDDAGQFATLVWHGGTVAEADLAPYEFVVGAE